MDPNSKNEGFLEEKDEQHSHEASLASSNKSAASDREPVAASTNEEATNNDTDVVYPGTAKLTLLLSAAALAIFLVALDTSIISTAIPRITEDFHSLDDVGWYGSGFLVSSLAAESPPSTRLTLFRQMTLAAFQSMFGKAYKYFSVKIVFLLAIFIFELGSLICAVAPNSTALIAGRAIAGVGGSGVTSGTYLIVGISAPPARTPALLGVIGASFAVASVVSISESDSMIPITLTVDARLAL